MPPISTTLLDKSARDAGFEIEARPWQSWRGYRSAYTPLKVWLRGDSGAIELAVDQPHVAAALVAEGFAPHATELPPTATAAFVAADREVLHPLLCRAGALARALPTVPLERFVAATRNMPVSTEAERLAVQRVGQDIFRAELLDYWGGRCPLTGLAVPQLLRASHIKPWKDCATDAERLDVFNGLLLAPHIDLAFDQGFISFSDYGDLLVSAVLGEADRNALGLDRELPRLALTDAHRAYLGHHRARVMRPTRGREA